MSISCPCGKKMMICAQFGGALIKGFHCIHNTYTVNVILSNYYALSNRHRSRLDVWCKTICSNGN